MLKQVSRRRGRRLHGHWHCHYHWSSLWCPCLRRRCRGHWHRLRGRRRLHWHCPPQMSWQLAHVHRGRQRRSFRWCFRCWQLRLGSADRTANRTANERTANRSGHVEHLRTANLPLRWRRFGAEAHQILKRQHASSCRHHLPEAPRFRLAAIATGAGIVTVAAASGRRNWHRSLALAPLDTTTGKDAWQNEQKWRLTTAGACVCSMYVHKMRIPLV